MRSFGMGLVWFTFLLTGVCGRVSPGGWRALALSHTKSTPRPLRWDVPHSLLGITPVRQRLRLITGCVFPLAFALQSVGWKQKCFFTPLHQRGHLLLEQRETPLAVFAQVYTANRTGRWQDPVPVSSKLCSVASLTGLSLASSAWALWVPDGGEVLGGTGRVLGALREVLELCAGGPCRAGPWAGQCSHFTPSPTTAKGWGWRGESRPVGSV